MTITNPHILILSIAVFLFALGFLIRSLSGFWSDQKYREDENEEN